MRSSYKYIILILFVLMPGLLYSQSQDWAVTREDRTKPGVVYSKGSDFYDAYKMELEQGRKLYTHLDLSLIHI